MKKTAKIIFSVILTAIILALSVSCGGNGEGAQSGEQANGGGTATIVGAWMLPEAEWISQDKPEVWVFDEDGTTFHYYQLNGQKEITNTINGSYKLEGDQLTITMSGWTLPPYTVKLTDADTMLRKDHDTEATLIRYKDELKNKTV